MRKLFASFDKEFEEAWENDQIPGWKKTVPTSAPTNGDASGEGIWCAACKKGFAKETVFEAHLTGKKHKKALEASQNNAAPAQTNGTTSNIQRFKERAVAERE